MRELMDVVTCEVALFCLTLLFALAGTVAAFIWKRIYKVNLNREQESTSRKVDYDVIIVGGGIAGVSQHLHFLKEYPEIRVCMIDSKPAEREIDPTNMGVGESLVEIPCHFFAKDLELAEYLVENHQPKNTLSSHWPWKHDKTEDFDKGYIHAVSMKSADLPVFQLDKAKFERDTLRIMIERGGEYIQARVVDTELTKHDRLHTITLKDAIPGNNTAFSSELRSLTCKHLVDASGRNFLTNRKTDNKIKLEEQRTAAVWLHVENVDRSIIKSLEISPGPVPVLYTTMQIFGHKHWVWLVPTTCTSKKLNVSIGMTYDRDEIPCKSVNTKEKFHSFLNANHSFLGKLIDSGKMLDCRSFPSLAYKPTTFFSEDNWYLIGDSSVFLDPLYGPGAITICFQAPWIATIISDNLRGHTHRAELKRASYDSNLKALLLPFRELYKCYPFMGNATIMSSAVVWDWALWFSFLVPFHQSKWYLGYRFYPVLYPVAALLAFATRMRNSVFQHMHESGRNSDYLNVNNGLTFWGMTEAIPNARVGGIQEYQKEDNFNLFTGLRKATMLQFILLWNTAWRGYGIFGFLRPTVVLGLFTLAFINILCIPPYILYELRNMFTPHSPFEAKLRATIRKTYFPKKSLVAWETKDKAPKVVS